MDVYLSPKCSNVAITALKFCDGYLLSGEGSFLHIYNVSNSSFKEINCYKIFQSVIIHSISIKSYDMKDNFQVCLLGGKYIRICKFDSQFNIQEISQESYMFDWNKDCIWSNLNMKYINLDSQMDNNVDCLILYQCRNNVAIVDVKSLNIIRIISCQEVCLLYSSKIIFETKWNGIVALGGTVFNQVIIWIASSPYSEHHNNEPSPVVHRLIGHDGVILGIDWNNEKQQICSVSDDRSLRLWQLILKNDSIDNDVIKDYSYQSYLKWKDSTFECLFVVYGHAARIWGVKNISTSIITIGEDAVCNIWNAKGNLIRKFKGHKGKNIWSLDVSKNEEIIATGGADSSIRIWKLNSYNSTSSLHIKPLLLQPNFLRPEDFPRTIQLINYNRLIVMTDKGQLSIYTIEDIKWNILMDNLDYSSYSIVSHNQSGNVIVIGNIKGNLMLLLIENLIVVNKMEIKIYDGKVFSIQWLNDTNSFLTTGPEGNIIVWNVSYNKIDETNTLSSKKKIFHSKNDKINLVLIESGKCLLPISSQRWVTSASLQLSNNTLICGDRQGSVHVYDWKKIITNSKDSVSPDLTLNKEFGSTGVTHICNIDDNQVLACGRDGHVKTYNCFSSTKFDLLESSLISKGFNWLTRIIYDSNKDDQIILGFLSNRFVAYSQNLNQFLMSLPCGGGHRAWDFKLKHATEKSDDSLFNEFNSYRMVYIKKREIALFEDIIESSDIIVKNNIQCLNTSCILHVTSLQYAKDQIDLLISSGEDGILHNLITCNKIKDVNSIIKSDKLYQPSNLYKDPFKLISSTKAHTSNIRTLSIIQTSTNNLKNLKNLRCLNFLLFSGGGGGTIKIWNILWKLDNNEKLNVDMLSDFIDHDCNYKEIEDNFSEENSKIIVNCSANNEALLKGSEKSLADNLKCFMKLNYTYIQADKYRKSYKPWKGLEIDLCPETRYMTIEAICLNKIFFENGEKNSEDLNVNYENFCVLLTGCSSGYLRIFLYDIEEKKLISICESTFHEHCLLKIKYLISQFDSQLYDIKLWIFSGSTDGKIAIWELYKLVKNGLINYLQHKKFAKIKNSIHINVENKPKFNTADEYFDKFNSNFKNMDINFESKTDFNEYRDKENIKVKKSKIKVINKEDLTNQKLINDNNCENSKSIESLNMGHPCCVLNAHQCGVNSLDVCQLEKDCESDLCLIASGGDDNSISLGIFDFNSSKIVCQEVYPFAHFAQIIGLKIILKRIIVSVSLDKRLIVWIIRDFITLKMEKLVSLLVDVSDINHLEIFQKYTEKNDNQRFVLVVSGSGIQKFDLTIINK